MGELAFVNGEFTDIASARVSIEDRGFQFGDGVYEVIRCYGGKLFALDEHLARLQRSAKAIDLELCWSLDQLSDLSWEMVRRSRIQEGQLYMQVTRGAAPRQHLFPEDAHPTLVMTMRQAPVIPQELRDRGASAITVPDLRWGRCDIKSINLLANVLAKQRAHSAGAFEAILVRDRLVTEGSSSNVFAISGGELVTPPADNRILHGITRGIVLELARQLKIKASERDISCEELKSADEVFITSTTTELLPIVSIDDELIGRGCPGEITKALYAAYQAKLPR